MEGTSLEALQAIHEFANTLDGDTVEQIIAEGHDKKGALVKGKGDDGDIVEDKEQLEGVIDVSDVIHSREGALEECAEGRYPEQDEVDL